MRFFCIALLAIAAVSALQAEDSNAGLDNPFSRQNCDNNGNTEKICEPYKLFKKFCNTCVCTSDGTSAACTNKECPEGLYNEDGTIKPSGENERCEPQSHFKVNCNDCYCRSNGLGAICTYRPCPDTTCEPGTVTRKDCDECTCTPSGKKIVCAAKYCPDPFDPRFQYTADKIEA